MTLSAPGIADQCMGEHPMTLPRLLLVDDSQAILTYEQTALAGLYSLSTASNGVEALEKVRALRPDGILLDLSMPEMNGDEVLRHLQADPALRDIPVIIVSSEQARAASCVKNGAMAYLSKPVRADELRLLVARTLEEVGRKARSGSLAVLRVGVGSQGFAVPLAGVLTVLHEVPTRPLPFGPHFLRETFDYGSRPVCVLDLGRALGERYREPLQDRKLVLMKHEDLLLALRVDAVHDPEEYLASDIVRQAAFGGAEHGELPRVFHAMARTANGSVPIVDPCALLSPKLISELAEALSSAVVTAPRGVEEV
jgi:CheY-like chemotaxis protein